MAKKRGKGGSSTKIVNKQNNKLFKQGKIQKQRQLQQRKRRKGLREAASKEQEERRRVNPQGGETDAHNGEVDKEDVKYFLSRSQHLAFANLPKHLTKEAHKRKRKLEEEDDDVAHFEEVPRKMVGHDVNAKMKMLLPIKVDKGKVISRMAEEEEADEEMEMETGGESMLKQADGDEDLESEIPLRPLTNAQLFATRKKKLDERKKTIALLATHILENPQENIRRLRDLRQMLNEKEPDLCVTVRKLVMVSLMEVFKDIIPGYKIRLMTDQEKAQQLKKETRSLQEYESALLQNYKLYLEHLELSIKGKAPKTKKQPEMEIPKEVSKKVSQLACRCMCELLVRHPHFNYTSNIITVMVPLLRRSPQLTDQVIQMIRSVFRDDKSGQVTLEIVRSLSKMMKGCNFNVKPKVLQTFLCLKIKEVDLSTSGETRKVEKRKEQLQKLSRKERKRKKAMDKINQELQEVKATEDKNKKLKLHTEVIHAVFVTYFRILKTATTSVLLPSVLEGLAKFAHLINIEFFDDLFRVFQQLLSSNELTYRERLHCVKTAFTILSGQGSALNIDPMNFYRHMYNTLLQVHAGSSDRDIPIILNCLDLMIHRRRKQVSQQRVLSYVKRLCSMTLQQLPHAMLALLSAVRSLVQAFPYTDRLYDGEAEGSGVFRPDIEDPEHCNAHNTAVWELSLLRHHFHPAVCQYAAHVGRQAPSTGEGQLPPRLARLSPETLYNQNDLSTKVLDASTPEKLQAKKKKKKKFHSTRFQQKDFSEYVEKLMNSVPDRISNVESMDIGQYDVQKGNSICK